MEIKPLIQLKNKETGEKKNYQIDQRSLLIGRDASNYIVLESKTISRKHAEILSENNQYFIRDLKSNNGTFINNQKIPTQEKTLLKSGDTIRIEGFEMLFRIPASTEVEDIYESTDTDLLEVKMVKKLLKAMDKANAPSIEVTEGPHAGKRFTFEGKNQTMIIGRDASCEFSIDSNVISRKHVRIEKHFDTLILHDLDSKNGTYINREKVKEKRLQDGDIIHLGTLPFIFRNPEELAFELSPPKPKNLPNSDINSAQESSPPLPESRSATENDAPETPPQPHSDSQPNDPAHHSSADADETAGQDLDAQNLEAEDIPSKLSLNEMIAIGVGLIVLVGSIWFLIKIF